MALALSACNGGGGGGTVNPPKNPAEPVQPQPQPIAAEYLPAAGFWNGRKAAGPWCQGKVSTQSLHAQSVSEESLLAAPTDAMRGLSGLSENLTGLTVQSAGPQELALLLPTGEDAGAALARVKAQNVTVDGEFGYWITVQATPAQAQRLVAQGLVQYAEKLPTLKTVGLPAPSDATLGNQSKYLPMMNTQAAWSQLDLGCDHPVVAVIDGGWTGSTTHAEYNLVPQSAWFNPIKAQQGNAESTEMNPGYDHGTAVAGVIAMTTNGYGAGASVSYNLAKVLPINARTTGSSIGATAAVQGIEYAVGQTTINGQVFTNPYPASVINLSFGSDATRSPSQFFQSAFTAAANRGVVIVAAAGNELASGTTDTAGLNHSIGVAGVMFDGNRWVDPHRAGFGSNYGPGVDVAAPAMAVPTMVNGAAEFWSGTSMATPWVSAQIAMWMYANQHYRADGSRTQGLRGDALYNKLYACFAAIGSNRGTKDEYLGFGKLDTGRLVSPTEAACR
ncbi:S8/S53 family peptidase [Deinococcus terrestris]|nr:S8/S53 family peptidase [Deinococcus terrestris]